ncbi:MAG: hypothetical protein JWQ35_2536 [Bacteriovoracaceae bacterium]|nr:hypothetical protein [Bacteriovoracaceae bacterium]
MPRQAKYVPPKLGKLLLVEDEELIGLSLKKELEKKDLNVQWTPSFSEAYRILKECDVHALVTDVYITPPEPDGLKLVKFASDFGIPSIIITSALDVEVAKQGLNRGADFLIEKPVQADELLKQLMQIWENPRGLIARRERYLSLHKLTQKECELCRLILKGLTNQEIADSSETTVGTIKFYSSQIFEKFEVKNRAELFNLIFPT